jgi:ATP-dependent DNA helicase DinG
VEDKRPKSVSELLEEVASGLPSGGEKRPGQLQMTEAVAKALVERRHLVVQAGTGTGKSLAYLLPAVRAGRPVVVATATKALQDQLANKDLPFLASRRPPGSFSYAVLKGRSNYLCRQRMSEFGTGTKESDSPVAQTFDYQLDGKSPSPSAKSPTLAKPASSAKSASSNSASSSKSADMELSGDGAGSRLGQQVKRLAEWGEQSPTGDRAELDFEPDPRAWAAVSVGPRECPGAFRCPHGTDCFTEQARARAAAADIVVVNTHLYATHVASGGVVLPEHDAVIFDEAHEVEDIMTAGLGVELTAGRIRAVAQAARGLVGRDDAGILEALTEVAEDLDQSLRPLAGLRVLRGSQQSNPDSGYGRSRRRNAAGRDDRENRDSSDDRLDLEDPDGMSLQLARPGAPGVWGLSQATASSSPPRAAGSALSDLLALIDGRVSAVTLALRQADRPERGNEHPDVVARRQRAVQSASHLTEDVRALATADNDHVAWVESSGPGGRQVTLRLAPIEVGPVLAERLWPNVTAVLTSATIPPRVAERLGIQKDNVKKLDVASPFPYGDQAMLYCATSLPDRRSAGAEEAIADELAALINAAGGRTLALFTSWRAMSATCDRLRPLLGFPIYAQGDLPKPRLLEAFSSDEAACLFATVSFWQGVDIPGRTLTLVAVDRLPFARPDDPLVQARRDRAGTDAFSTIDLPRAATLLAQGAGRLIRSSSDSGVVAVLDRRLATAGYGGVLRASLPPMKWTTDRRLAIKFLEKAVATTKTGDPA